MDCRGGKQPDESLLPSGLGGGHNRSKQNMGSLDLAGLKTSVEEFVARAAMPAVLDPGEEPLPLLAGQWGISTWSGRLVLEAWDAQRNLVRKISGIREVRRDRLRLISERFPKAEGELQIADLAAPAGVEIGRRTSRAAFRERFQFLLAREWPTWKLDDLSMEPNLEESLSTTFARAFLRQGSGGLAVMAAPPDMEDCAGVVGSGLIWLDYLRRREPKIDVRGLVIYVPLRRQSAAAARATWIDPGRVTCQMLVYDERDRVAAIDAADTGNVESALPYCPDALGANRSSVIVRELPQDVDRVDLGDGSFGYRVRGLEFAREMAGKLTVGVGRRTRSSADHMMAMAREIARVRSADAPAETRQHPLYTARPEGWLESVVRAQPNAVDASLRRQPIYGQVPVFSGGERGVIDLVGIDCTGRLAVIELKATEDLQLPFQALDYWMRVKKHLEAGDFERQGYFPGIMLRREAPRLLLVAPALEFHSTIDRMIGYLRPEIEFVRIGVGADWRRQLRVMFRLRGDERP